MLGPPTSSRIPPSRSAVLTFECRSSLGPLRRHRHKPALRRRHLPGRRCSAHAVGSSWLSVTRFWDVEPDHPVRGSSLAFADAHGSRGDRHSQKSTPELVAAGPEARGVSGLAGSHGRRHRCRRGCPLLGPRHPHPGRARDPVELHARPDRHPAAPLGSGSDTVSSGRGPASLRRAARARLDCCKSGRASGGQPAEVRVESAHQDPRSAHRRAERRRRRADLGHAARSPPGTPGGDEDACRERGQERGAGRGSRACAGANPAAGRVAPTDATRGGRTAGRADRHGGPGGGLRDLHAAPARGPARSRSASWSAPATSPAPPKP